ncbi:MAG TPA: prolyl oligopeptidase family serine peptidase [Steroidobacteraceae bacterium]|nr:prolyl oligopeptidase family serine peptidase [Steroidobacteraceae bacterium]
MFLLPLLAAPLLWASAPLQAAPVVRGNLILDGVPDRPLESAEVLDAYLGARQASLLGFGAKGQLLIATRFGDVDQLHLVDQPLGERRQITFLRDPIARGALSPDPGRSAWFYLQDADGGDGTQLYYQRLGEAVARRLSDGKSVNGGAIWSSAGRAIAFFTRAPGALSDDIDIVDPESGALPRLAVAGDDAAWFPLDWSPDDRQLLVQQHVSAYEDHLYVIDLSSGQKREVDPAPAKSPAPAAIAGARFSRDGTGVYFISNREGEYARLRFVNSFTGEKTDISDKVPFDVDRMAVSRDGHYLAYVTNEGGADRLDLVDLRAHQDLVPPHLPAGIIDSLAFDLESKRLAFGLSAANAPRDVYVLDLASNRLEPWTASEAGPVDRSKLVVPRLTQFPTFDRVDGRSRQIPVYVYAPASAGPHPVLIVLHDGPGGEFRPSFDPWIEYVVNALGFAVLAPDMRGSSGLGKGFAALARGKLRGDAVKDVGALLVWLALDGRFDAKRVFVSGTGYGGYLALEALVNYAERLRGGIALAPITDLIDFVSASGASRPALREEFGDERDTDMRAFLRNISPLTSADRITRPVLLAHGKLDARVPIGQSQELLNRLRSRNQVVWYLEAQDEGHALGHWRWQNREAYYRAFAQFLTTIR